MSRAPSRRHWISCSTGSATGRSNGRQPEFKYLTGENQMTKQQHAIVIGGSMAGMCAARILADHFEKVTIVDRDHYPDGAFERAGVPQSRHVHVLLARGRIELENLFPGFEQTVLSRGALDTDFGWDFAALRVNGWAPREVYGIKLLHGSRVLLESVVREKLRKHSNVEFVEGA